MQQLNIPLIRFQFDSPLHIGNERGDYGKGNMFLHSDSLTAAIYFAWARLGLANWIPKEDSPNPRFVVSSLFPYCNNEETKVVTYFLPRPMIRLKNEENVDTKLRKKLKKIAYVDTGIFFRMLKGGAIPAEEGNISGIYRSMSKIPGDIVKSQVVPRASVSRDGIDDTVIFYMERHYFSTGSGLYTLVEFEDAEVEKRVRIAINFLSEEGLGTDRNIGNGKFIPHFGESLTFDISEQSESAVNLGLYCPSDQNELKRMLDSDTVGYNLIRRAGWLSEPYNTWRKKEIYMFTEGSIFNFSANLTDNIPVFGKMDDVRPVEVSPALKHPVWRSGRSIFIPF